MTLEIQFSVIIPAYNGQKVLSRAVESVLRQTYPALEIIVVDDGSTDQTSLIAQSYGPPVRCIRQVNGGVSSARNRGIQEAQGEFVAFLDADDEWYDHHLAAAAEILGRTSNLHWYSSRYDEHYLDGRRDVGRGVPESDITSGSALSDYLEVAPRMPASLCPATVIVRKTVLEEVGMFEPSMRTGEDPDLWFRIGLRYPRMGYGVKPGAIYWREAESLSYRTPIDFEQRLYWLRRRRQLALDIAGEDGVRRSRKLLESSAYSLYRLALGRGRKDVLKAIAREWKGAVPWRLRLVGTVCWMIPAGLLAGLTLLVTRWRGRMRK